MRRPSATLLLAVALTSCVTNPRPTRTPNGDDIRIYVYYAGNGPHEPIAGATVLLLGTDGRVITTATTDRLGEAVVPASYDVSTTTYILADMKPFLITGVRWTSGRREYNLPLQIEPLVNRLRVKAP